MLCSVGFSQVVKDSTKVQQLDEVVISDSRFELNRENSGKVITKITRADLEKVQGQSIAQIINRTVGVEINGARSNAGQQLNYYVRGGRNRQVLILIDGIQLSDASQIANDYDLRLLNSDQVESIEILKGASSTLYGSNAATAVINIKLKSASKKPFQLSLRSSLGSNQNQDESDYRIEDFKNSVTLNGALGKFNYLASFGHQFTDGLSAISSGTELDAFNSHNGILKLGYRFSNAFNLNLYGSFDNFRTEFDDAFFLVDANNISTSKQYRIGLSSEFKYSNGSLIVNAALNTIDRDIESNFPATFKAEGFIVDTYNRYNFNNQFYTVLGLNVQQQNMESFAIPFGSTNLVQSINPDVAKFTTTDPYANIVYVSDFGLNVNAGLRLNNHNEYGSHLVYSLNPSYRFNTDFGYLKGITSYSTAYIVPSLFQLFDASFGNIDLEPEENQTFEVGAELSIANKATFSIVYFNRNQKQFIDFVDTGNFVFQYQNIEETFNASGLEFSGDIAFFDTLKLHTNFTYTKVEDLITIRARIPEFSANARIDYQFSDATLMSLSYQYGGERADLFTDAFTFQSQEVTLKDFSIIDLYFSHKLIKNKLTLFANISNIFDEDYEELFGFTTLGRNVNIGFNLNL